MAHFAKDGPLSEDGFAKLMSDAIRQTGETRRITYDRESFCLYAEGEEGLACDLSNLYQEYCATAEKNRDAKVRWFVRSWFACRKKIPDDFEDVLPDLLPCLLSIFHYESMGLSTQLEGIEEPLLPHQVIGEHLGVSLVYDLPEVTMSIPQGTLDTWGVNFYEAMEVAKQNLARKVAPTFASPGRGLYVSDTKDCYDATRMVLLDLLRHFDVDGDYIAMVPHRDRLIVTGSDEEAGLKMMASIAENEFQKTRGVSRLAFRLNGDEWEPWLPDAAHPLYKKFAMFRTQAIGEDYFEQQELLGKLNKKKGDDALVADFSGVHSEDRTKVFSYSVWEKDVPAMLPKVDKLALIQSNNDKPDILDWDAVTSVAGDLMTPLGIYPERYRVTAFPNEEQLKAMRDRCVADWLTQMIAEGLQLTCLA